MMTSSARPVARLLLLALLALCAPVAAQMPEATVVVDVARQETVEQYREVVGELRAARRALLAAEDDGLVVEMNLLEGDTVEAGQVIARLRDSRAEMDVRRAGAELAARRAALAERMADLERAQRDLAKVDELRLLGSAAETEIEDRRTAVAVAEARLLHAQAEIEAAESALELARDTLERRTVIAPFGGVVVAKRTEVGQWLRQGDPVLEIVDLDHMEARLHVPESLVDFMQSSADAVRIRIQATGETITAPVSAIIPDADPLSRLVPVRLRLENRGHRLRPGMSIAGLVAAGRREPTLTVHKDAILRDDAGAFVFFTTGGPSQVARVQTLFPVGERVAVRSPMLRAGVQVVVEGNERLAPGMPLNIAAIRPGPAKGDATAPGAAPAGDGGTLEPNQSPQEQGR